MKSARMETIDVEILYKVKLGRTDKEIARASHFSVHFAGFRLSRFIYSRLGAKNRAHSVYIAMRRGII